MFRTLSVAMLSLLSSPVFAAAEELVAASGPAETVSIVYVVIFGVLFFGMIAGFFVYLWWNETKKTPGDGN